MACEGRNIGIFAHVDAGKTTLSEQLLLVCGEIRKAGRVDDGTAHTDRLEVERRRGISVKAACARLMWRGIQIRLVDTPGHADFTSEIERGLWAIDAAVLVISATDGVQAQTELLFESLKKYRVPTLIFVNKCDRETADFSKTISQARKMLSDGIFDMSDKEECMAAVAEHDELALAAYAEGEIWQNERLMTKTRELARSAHIFPALAGSALTGDGCRELLDAVCDCLPHPEGDENGGLCGIVFACEDDPAMGRAAYVRLYSGMLKNRDTVGFTRSAENEYGSNETTVQRKISQIRTPAASGKGFDAGEMRAGDIAIVYGLTDVITGSALGDATLLPERVKSGELRAPLYMAKVAPANEEQLPALKSALEQLSAEDPLLETSIIARSPHVRLMGAIQTEVLSEELQTRFSIKAAFSPPETIYRETIKQTAVGFIAYTMPKPCWAVIKFEISPAPRGSGVTYESLVAPNEIKPRYQHQISQAIRTATRQGMLGWQVDDVRIRLIGGEDHDIHTHPLDFIVATPMAFMDGLRRGGSVLLEPILELRITVDANMAGKIIGEMNNMRGSVLSTEGNGDKITLTCEAPAKEAADLPVRLARLTSGRAYVNSRLKGYRECDLALGATCPRRGVNPLDTQKYILAARNALDGNIYD